MRILLANQFFWPDSAATSQLLTDVARGLADRGHEVAVVCGSAGYSEEDKSDPPDVTIHRSKTFPFGRSKLARLLSYFTFFCTASINGLLARKYDVVVTLTTPPLLSVLGTAMRRLRGTKHFIWEMDVYPEIAVDVGMWQADSLVTRIVGSVADYSRGHADGVIALGDCMRTRLMRRGLEASKIVVAENWADGQSIEPLPLRSNPALRVLYSGNFGLAHDVSTIQDTILLLNSDPRFAFIFAGGGASRKDLEEVCRSRAISNAFFRPYCRREDLGKSLSDGDLGLVTQKQSCSGSVVPSKVYGLMGAGRPILYIGPRDSTPAHVILKYRCGWQVDVGDSQGLMNLLEVLYADPQLVSDTGQRARQAFLEHYDLPIGVARICAAIGATRSSGTVESDTRMDSATSAYRA